MPVLVTMGNFSANRLHRMNTIQQYNLPDDMGTGSVPAVICLVTKQEHV